MSPSPFFPRLLDPVLDGGKRDKDTMVPPKMPRSGSVRQTVLDDQSHGSRDHAVGVAAPRQREVRHVGVEVLLTPRTKMLGVPDMEIHRSFRSRIPHVVEDAFHPAVSVRAVVTAGARLALVVTAALDDLWSGKVFYTRDPLGSIRSVLSGCGHLDSLQARNGFLPGKIGPKSLSS